MKPYGVMSLQMPIYGLQRIDTLLYYSIAVLIH